MTIADIQTQTLKQSYERSTPAYTSGVQVFDAPMLTETAMEAVEDGAALLLGLELDVQSALRDRILNEVGDRRLCILAIWVQHTVSLLAHAGRWVEIEARAKAICARSRSLCLLR